MRISTWEEESGLQSALYKVEKLCGQAGMIPNPHAEQAHVQGSHCCTQKAETQISSSHCSAHGQDQPQGGCGSPLIWTIPVPCPSTCGAAQTLRAAPRAEINAGAGKALHLLRSWATEEALSYGRGGLAPWHRQAPSLVSVSLLSNTKQGEQPCNGS